MKIYISGKITGDRRYKAKFREVEKKLAAAGHIVLNPATAPEGLRPVDYMRLCFAMMEAADVVLFMQDYQDSRGAMLEWAWCQYVGKQTCFDLAALIGAAFRTARERRRKERAAKYVPVVLESAINVQRSLLRDITASEDQSQINTWRKSVVKMTLAALNEKRERMIKNGAEK